MTLCVAWKVGDKSYLASDSRISRADMYSDYGIKVCPLHVRIYEPASEGKKAPLIFSKVYSFAFSGSFVGAYVVKEYLAITLQKLQYISGRMELSFRKICETVNILYNENIKDGHNYIGLTTPLIAYKYCRSSRISIKTMSFYS